MPTPVANGVTPKVDRVDAHVLDRGRFVSIEVMLAGDTTLNSLTPDEALDLLRHRMSVAGGDFDRIFPLETHKALYNATNGVPRDL
jgi:hypothetical protein